ncbi:MAG: hypothetical protein ABIJ16_05875 [Bacteroidota bacterium]|nr:hypothetical protein [Elusimicrobiota bacterium]
MDKFEINKFVKFSEDGPSKEIFYNKGDLKAQILCMKAGQTIPPCKMNNDVLFYTVEGEGEITVDDRKEVLLPGVSVIIPKEAESRSMYARTDMVILGVQAVRR